MNLKNSKARLKVKYDNAMQETHFLLRSKFTLDAGR
jgi:hypothetical protein